MTWKSIPGYEDLYQINNSGEIKRLARIVLRRGGRLLPMKEIIKKLGKTPDGYFKIDLYKNKTIKWCGVHRLVALTFIPNPENKPCINHKNGIKTDNRVENLEWCTVRENVNHAYANGLQKGKKGETNPRSKLTSKQVLEIRAIHKPFSLEFGNRALGKKYGVSEDLIYQIISRRIWKHI